MWNHYWEERDVDFEDRSKAVDCAGVILVVSFASAIWLVIGFCIGLQF